MKGHELSHDDKNVSVMKFRRDVVKLKELCCIFLLFFFLLFYFYNKIYFVYKYIIVVIWITKTETV